MTPADEAVAALAARQYGAFNRAQAFAAGVSGRMIDRRLQHGDWVRLDHGVYGLAHSRGTWLRQLKVAELGATDAAIAGRAAAALHELAGFRPGRPEICVPLTSTTRGRVARVHRYAGARVTTVKGLRCTTIAQTLFDLAACRVAPWAIERAMDDAILTKRLAVDDLEERLSSYRQARRHGLVLMRALVEERAAEGWTPPESELEARAAQVLAQATPGWVRQHPLPFRVAAAGRVDFALPSARLLVEADGRRWHARVDAFDRDRWRDNEATAAGWRVLRFTWVHLTAAPDDCVELVRRTLGYSMMTAMSPLATA